MKHLDCYIILQLTVLLSFYTKLDITESFTSRASAIDIFAFDKRSHFSFKQIWYRGFHDSSFHFTVEFFQYHLQSTLLESAREKTSRLKIIMY